MPVLYNITTKVTPAIAEAWLQWMQEEHIPAILSTELFIEHRLLRLLDQDDSEGPTYSLQLTASHRNQYETYLQQFAPQLREATYLKWGNQFISFRSLLAFVN
ncbi:MAG: DUF4286 family protein [Sediminibacterium sp.]|nr:DUF4286 family protein [Sediminibacterium sp.]